MSRIEILPFDQLLSMTTGLDWNELEFDYHDETEYGKSVRQGVGSI